MFYVFRHTSAEFLVTKNASELGVTPARKPNTEKT